jgi:hypothetical protein
MTNLLRHNANYALQRLQTFLIQNVELFNLAVLHADLFDQLSEYT